MVLDAYLGEPERSDVAEGVEAGTLEGISLAGAPLVAVATASGVTIVDARTLDVVEELPTVEPVTGLALVERGLDDPTLYAASGDTLAVIPFADDGPAVSTTVRMPGVVRTPAWNEPANLLHVAGTSPSGAPTLYVVELHSNAVFGDAELPFEPGALLLDLQPERPSADRGQALAIATDGRRRLGRRPARCGGLAAARRADGCAHGGAHLPARTTAASRAGASGCSPARSCSSRGCSSPTRGSR